jgi:hypothetical protein
MFIPNEYAVITVQSTKPISFMYWDLVWICLLGFGLGLRIFI